LYLSAITILQEEVPMNAYWSWAKEYYTVSVNWGVSFLRTLGPGHNPAVPSSCSNWIQYWCSLGAT
jgi:hypothetical protein